MLLICGQLFSLQHFWHFFPPQKSQIILTAIPSIKTIKGKIVQGVGYFLIGTVYEVNVGSRRGWRGGLTGHYTAVRLQLETAFRHWEW